MTQTPNSPEPGRPVPGEGSEGAAEPPKEKEGERRGSVRDYSKPDTDDDEEKDEEKR